MNLFQTSKSKTNSAKIREIKNWVYQHLAIDPEIPISVSQLQCHEPDCPPLETVIAIMRTPPQQYKIHQSIEEIQELDIKQLALLN